jgi:ecotin
MLLASNAIAQKQQKRFEKLDISMYPKTMQGYKQIVIQLPIEKNEENLKIELFIGIEKMVDCNNHTLEGKSAEKNIDGGAYNYFMVESTGVSLSTKMACLDPPTRKFVTMPPILSSYNSKLPIVIYVPQNIEVKYRIWRADSMIQKGKSK